MHFDQIKPVVCAVMLMNQFGCFIRIYYKSRIAQSISNLTLDYTYIKSLPLPYPFPNLITSLPIQSVIPATYLGINLNSFPCLKASHEICHISVILIPKTCCKYIISFAPALLLPPCIKPLVSCLHSCVSSDSLCCFGLPSTDHSPAAMIVQNVNQSTGLPCVKPSRALRIKSKLLIVAWSVGSPCHTLTNLLLPPLAVSGSSNPPGLFLPQGFCTCTSLLRIFLL